jgi:hypothetical protein
VCLAFDKLIEYRTTNFLHNEKDDFREFGITAMDSEEALRQFVGLWSLIPLTRAIDTLVITLTDSQSGVANILMECFSEDYVELV